MRRADNAKTEDTPWSKEALQALKEGQDISSHVQLLSQEHEEAIEGCTASTTS